MLNLIELPWQRIGGGLSSSDDTAVCRVYLSAETWNTKTETNVELLFYYQRNIKELRYTAGVDGWWTLNGNERVAIFRW
jgi:hypothetical protein